MTVQNNDKDAVISRRVDHDLRKSINTLQELLFDPGAHNEICGAVVQELITLTHSDLGVIVETGKGLLWKGYKVTPTDKQHPEHPGGAPTPPQHRRT